MVSKNSTTATLTRWSSGFPISRYKAVTRRSQSPVSMPSPIKYTSPPTARPTTTPQKTPSPLPPSVPSSSEASPYAPPQVRSRTPSPPIIPPIATPTPSPPSPPPPPSATPSPPAPAATLPPPVPVRREFNKENVEENYVLHTLEAPVADCAPEPAPLPSSAPEHVPARLPVRRRATQTPTKPVLRETPPRRVLGDITKFVANRTNVRVNRDPAVVAPQAPASRKRTAQQQQQQQQQKQQQQQQQEQQKHQQQEQQKQQQQQQEQQVVKPRKRTPPKRPSPPTPEEARKVSPIKRRVTFSEHNITHAIPSRFDDDADSSNAWQVTTPKRPVKVVEVPSSISPDDIKRTVRKRTLAEKQDVWRTEMARLQQTLLEIDQEELVVELVDD